MEHFSITRTAQGLHIEGFPEAVKVIRIGGPKAQRLADLALHSSDLSFALDCLASLNQVPEKSWVLRQSLWRSAIVHFLKCFGESKGRFRLNAHSVYRGDAGAMEAYNYFSALRNKHVIHDENSYSQCVPGAVLNKQDAGNKIAKIVCLSITAETLEQNNYSNLHLLITRAKEWVTAQFDRLCDTITTELENKPYPALFKMQEICYTLPAIGDLEKSRRRL